MCCSSASLTHLYAHFIGFSLLTNLVWGEAFSQWKSRLVQSQKGMQWDRLLGWLLDWSTTLPHPVKTMWKSKGTSKEKENAYHSFVCLFIFLFYSFLISSKKTDFKKQKFVIVVVSVFHCFSRQNWKKKINFLGNFPHHRGCDLS